MIPFNPRHLKAFVAVARTGSVARAADIVSRVQSAITRSIQELEADLAVPLFERRPQGMRLTEFGSALLPRAEAVFAEMDAAKVSLSVLCGEARWNPNAPIFTLGIGRQRLLVFAELMKQAHMGAVARQFGLTLSAVSLALREVEQGVGVPLVSRLPTGITPNPVGERLALHLRRAFAEMTKAADDIASLREGVTGHVVVGTLSLGRNWLLPQAILRTTLAHPKIRVSTIEGTFEHLASLLRAAEIDFILGGLRPQDEMVGLTTQPVLSSGIVLLARKGHPMCEALATAGDEELAGARWVLPHQGTWTRSALENFLIGRGLGRADVVVETADTTIIRALVLGSDLITAASPHLFRDEMATGELVELPQPSVAPPRDIGIVTSADTASTVAARLLMEAVIAVRQD